MANSQLQSDDCVITFMPTLRTHGELHQFGTIEIQSHSGHPINMADVLVKMDGVVRCDDDDAFLAGLPTFAALSEIRWPRIGIHSFRFYSQVEESYHEDVLHESHVTTSSMMAAADDYDEINAMATRCTIDEDLSTMPPLVHSSRQWETRTVDSIDEAQPMDSSVTGYLKRLRERQPKAKTNIGYL